MCFQYLVHVVIVFSEREGARFTYIVHVSTPVCSGKCVQCQYVRYAVISSLCEGLLDYVCPSAAWNRPGCGLGTFVLCK